jgi:hypothetical protein
VRPQKHLLHLEGGAPERGVPLPNLDELVTRKRAGWLDRMKEQARARWERIVARRTRDMRFVETRTVYRAASDGRKVPITIAQKRSGGVALYRHGTGPFYTNRALRRSDGTRVR